LGAAGRDRLVDLEGRNAVDVSRAIGIAGPDPLQCSPELPFAQRLCQAAPAEGAADPPGLQTTKGEGFHQAICICLPSDLQG
jgi:hypothetical protein